MFYLEEYSSNSIVKKRIILHKYYKFPLFHSIPLPSKHISMLNSYNQAKFHVRSPGLCSSDVRFPGLYTCCPSGQRNQLRESLEVK